MSEVTNTTALRAITAVFFRRMLVPLYVGVTALFGIVSIVSSCARTYI